MAANYVILQVEPWTFLDPRSNPVEGYRVTFRTADGDTMWVDVARAEYNPETVQVKIEEVVQATQAIRAL